MGLYFLAAGSSSRNREKCLDRGFRRIEIDPFLDFHLSKKRFSPLFAMASPPALPNASLGDGQSMISRFREW